MSGFSALPSIFVFSSGLSAPDEVLGLTSPPVLTQVQTFGAVPLHITSVVATGDFAAVNQCPKDLLPGNACNLGVTFTPTAAGTRTGTLSIFDDAPGSPQTVPLVGNGLATYPAPSISFISPSSAPVGSGPVQLLIEGNEFFPTSTVTINGKLVLSKPGPFAEELLVTIPATLLTKTNSLSIQVVNPVPGGPSAPAQFVVFRQVAIGIADAVYEPFTQKFYASIPARATTNPNSLVTIDPTTGLVGPPIPIGNDPGPLAVSSDGTMLYVGLNSSNSIVPFNLLAQTAAAPIPLGTDPAKGPLTAATIRVQPNHPHNLIATLTAGFNGIDGIALIENGAVVSRFLNEPPSSVALGGAEFVGPNNVFGWNLNFGALGLLHFVISGKSLLEAPGISGQFGLGAFGSDGTNLYDVDGQIFNATSGVQIGTFSALNNFNPATAVLTDTSSGRTFVTDFFGDVLVFDDKSFSLVGNIGPTSADQPSRLQHWGPDGLAYIFFDFSNNGNDLLLMRTSLFDPAPGPNPLPKVTTLTPSPVLSKGSNFQLTVNGSNFIRGAVVEWNGSTRTTTWINGSKLVADIPASDIAAPHVVSVKAVNPAPRGGASTAVSLTVK